jgi:hypothetical protein
VATKKPAAKQPKSPGGEDPAGAATGSATKSAGTTGKVAADKPAARLAIRRQQKAEAAAGKAKTAPAAVEERHAKKEAPEKGKKVKLVRDSFTMPEAEYDLLAQVKKRCVAKGVAVKKSEVLRAAIASFAALSDASITKLLAQLEPIKTGRPPAAGK